MTIMNFPFEVLVTVFSYLRLNDMIEVSAVCKKNYFFIRKNKFFIGKLEESRKLLKDKIFNWWCLYFIWRWFSCRCTKKTRIISDPNRIPLAADRIKKKYRRQRKSRTLKKANKKATDWLKHADYLDNDNLTTIDYNNDTSLADLENLKMSSFFKTESLTSYW